MIVSESVFLDKAKKWEHIWTKRPFENQNGLGCQGGFALYFFLTEMNPAPEYVFEIGTWRGFSTWVIKQALPQAKIVCSDPILASKQFLKPESFLPEYRLTEVDYTWQDFSNMDINISPAMREKAVVFFDDHQNKVPRIKQAAEKGFKHIIFDDNVPFDYSHEALENLFRKNDRAKKVFMESFEDYKIFPPVFNGKTREKIALDGFLKEEFKQELPNLFSGKNIYSWVTKVELKDSWFL